MTNKIVKKTVTKTAEVEAKATKPVATVAEVKTAKKAVATKVATKEVQCTFEPVIKEEKTVSASKVTSAVKKEAVAVSKATQPVKKATAKAPSKAAVKSQGTVVVAKVDLGWGNTLFIRGEGAGLSWTKGIEMSVKGSDEWTIELSGGAEFKLLRNDVDWSQGALGENFKAVAGKKTIVSPEF